MQWGSAGNPRHTIRQGNRESLQHGFYHFVFPFFTVKYFALALLNKMLFLEFYFCASYIVFPSAPMNDSPHRVSYPEDDTVHSDIGQERQIS
jgi:hypothetical protein